ncbi:acyl-CoA dehydrogenase family protein [Mycobacterium sp. ITM-2016-00318]|uniref:acyl-CoA dehydrogenase family protein n=1 Tax=Mycobacterium sp. ITM-2016-00318 TaxID=2099693 RepID=UPI000CFA5BE8|nr:acyl-CoA dehydrogenase family protein [Mycobacterium sp. ITM-2016-00318]WNG91562.1 acyl-CoA dehydrogenase family protein [Mycobacterium sp. ITM-2016-00318]
MNLELTDEQLALRDTVRQYLAEKASVPGHVRPMLDDPTGSTDDVWHGLARLGATGVLVPHEHGGAGMTMVDAGVVAEELGAALYPGPWLSSAVAATRALTRTGAGGELLAGIADGTVVATVGGVTGSRPSADRRTLHGELTAVPDVAAATVLLVFADGADGPALYSVDPASRGVTVSARAHVDPTRKLFDVTLDGVAARRLADAPADAVEALVDDILIALAADAVGVANAVMQLAVDYAKVRKQFDQPIGSFQAVQHLCVDMYESVELARSGVIHALWAADCAEPAERHLAAIRAKAFAGRLAAVGDTAIQVFGGIGFTWEHDAHLYLKRLLGWSALFGPPDRYLEEVGAILASQLDRKVLL